MRRVLWSLAVLLVLLTALLGAAAYMAATPAGFRWLTGTMAILSGERLKFEDVEGHLGVPLRIRKLTVATASQRIEIEGVRLEWQPRALWQRRLEIDLLAAETVRVTTLKKDPAPPERPASLRLPLDLYVRVIDLDRLDLVEPADTLTFRKFRGHLDGRGDRYRLSEAALETPWAALTGQLELGKDAPFLVQGGMGAVRDDPFPVTGELKLAGTLDALKFQFNAAAREMRLLVGGEAAPFAPVRLPRLLVAGEGIDPQLFAAGAPRADLAFSGLFEGLPGERLLGTFSLNNRIAGRLDQGRVPFASLTGAVLGDAARADFSDLAVDFGAAGKLSGEGQWRDGRAALSLASPRLNLAGFHSDLHVTRMRTRLELTGNATRQALSADVAETWGQGRFVLTHDPSSLRLESASLGGQAGRLAARGELKLDAGRAFSIDFDASQINPARFGKFPRGRLNARGAASGTLLPELRLLADLTLPRGELEGQPVSGRGRLRYENRHLADADADLNLAGNLAKIKGAFGRAGDRLSWDIDAPALARLNLGFAGRLTSQGSVSGTPGRPQLDASAIAQGLRMPGDIAVDTLNLQLKLQAAVDGVFSGQLDARGVQLAGQRLNTLVADLQGRRNAHTLALDARLSDWRITARLAGGLDDEQVWRGQLAQAQAQGRWPMSLISPATLVLSGEQQQVNDLALTVSGGRLSIEQFNRRGSQMSSRGALGNLPLAPFLSMLETELPFTTDLRVNGDWDLRAGDTLDGTLHLRRLAGDVRTKSPAQSLGLSHLVLDLSAVANRVSGYIEATSREAGQLRVDAQAPLQRTEAFFTLPRTAPVAWTAKLDVPDMRLIRPFLPVGIRFDARLNAELTGGGSLAAPRADGHIVADGIRFSMPEQGVSTTGGRLRLVLSGSRVRVEEGVLQGQSGRIVLSGEARLKDPQAGLALNFEKFAVTNRSDRRVIVSGVSELAYGHQGLKVEGALRVDRARIEVPEASRPALSADVVVAGQPPPARARAQRVSLAFDLKLGLGDDFLFKGAGLDVRLGGQLRVFTVQDVLRAEGRIQVVEGRYAAYGQSLTVERGVLSFVGPVDNPGIDVLAVRKTPTVKAGVQVRGTVQRPLVTLYSDPPLPDTEKLSWLVLGHGLQGGQEEFALLQLAGGALLSRAESVSLQTQIADALSIDSFGVRAGEGEDLATAIVSVGKRLSSRATLSFEQSLDGLTQVVKVLYQLTPHVRLEAQTGQQSSFDAFYTLEYD